MRQLGTFMITAALVTGAAVLFPSATHAGSCCGGGVGVTLILPKDASAGIDVTFDWEKYNGFWNEKGRYLSDRANDLNQYRLNLAYAYRLAPRWQTSIAVPFIQNRNTYSGNSFHSSGVGDSAVSLWYEAFDTTMCRWANDPSWEDLVPSASFGLSLTIPTGVSPYDDAPSSFDTTGRGFYRVDGLVLLEKTLFPWSASIMASYGKYLERPVNREYGKYVQPYQKKLGDRISGTAVVSYVQFVDFGERRRIFTYSGIIAKLWEDKTEIIVDGVRDRTPGLEKTTATARFMVSTLDRRWNTHVSWNHSIMQDGWGNNFPASDIYSLGVTYVYK